MRLYIVRHGSTEWNETGRAQGHRDIPLSEIGLRQANCLADAWDAPAARILSSDLRRAQQTAEPIARRLGLPLELRPDIRERGFGDWEGEDYHAVISRLYGDPERHHSAVRPPNGESFEDVWVRIAEISRELSDLDTPTVVVTHGGTGGLLIARLMGGGPRMARAFRFGNTGVTELERREGDWHLTRYNDVSHLDGREARVATTV